MNSNIVTARLFYGDSIYPHDPNYNKTCCRWRLEVNGVKFQDLNAQIRKNGQEQDWIRFFETSSESDNIFIAEISSIVPQSHARINTWACNDVPLQQATALLNILGALGYRLVSAIKYEDLKDSRREIIWTLQQHS